jgi:hypothetical protein
MPSWRCPHCSTPQQEASRCWVCHRSSTSCGTCRQFRKSVAGRYGFCGLDKQRRPLAGDEVRACWEDAAVPLPPDPVMPGLLDLLSVGAGGEPPAAAHEPDDGDVGEDRALTRRESTPRTERGGRRLWIEVEA